MPEVRLQRLELTSDCGLLPGACARGLSRVAGLCETAAGIWRENEAFPVENGVSPGEDEVFLKGNKAFPVGHKVLQRRNEALPTGNLALPVRNEAFEE